MWPEGVESFTPAIAKTHHQRNTHSVAKPLQALHIMGSCVVAILNIHHDPQSQSPKHICKAAAGAARHAHRRCTFQAAGAGAPGRGRGGGQARGRGRRKRAWVGGAMRHALAHCLRGWLRSASCDGGCAAKKGTATRTYRQDVVRALLHDRQVVHALAHRAHKVLGPGGLLLQGFGGPGALTW